MEVGNVGGAGESSQQNCGGIPEAFGLEGGDGILEQVGTLLGADAAEEENALSFFDTGLRLKKRGCVVTGGIGDALVTRVKTTPWQS